MSKIVLVTGASSGYGKATAKAFKDNGDVVIIAARNEDKISAAQKEIGADLSVKMDVTIPQDWDKIVNIIKEKYAHCKPFAVYGSKIKYKKKRKEIIINDIYSSYYPIILPKTDYMCRSVSYINQTGSNIIDIDVIKQQIPVMLFKQRLKDDGSGETEGKIEDIETEYVDKKKTIYLDVEYEDVQNPTFNFRVERARIRPQGTSSMKYPKKNFRIYTRKKDDAGNYESKLFDYEGNEVSKRRYSFKTGAAPVDCWCLKADFAESSGTHNTGTARFWNNVLKEAGILTQAQAKAQKINYEYDVRTTIDGFPIVLFYQEIGSTPRFIGKYNFNNDKSTEDVFGFTGGPEVDEQEVMYFPIGKIAPVINDGDPVGAYTDNPTTESSLYAKDDDGNYYMLRGKELFDNPRMECWEMLDSGSLIGLFKTVEGFAVEREDKETQ